MQKPASEPTEAEALIYSGRVRKHDLADPEWQRDAGDVLNVRVVRSGGVEMLHLETMLEPVRALIKLDKRQANALFRCMRNAVACWDGREP